MSTEVKENKFGSLMEKWSGIFTRNEKSMTERPDPRTFWVIVKKEFGDYIRSWRIVILLAIILLTCIASLYTAITTISEAIDASSDAAMIGKDSYLFLKLFTISDGKLPSFVYFVSLLGPLLGIALGFDAINSERGRGTLSRLMSQPIPRDYVINAKFVAALILNSILFFSLGLLVMAFGILIIGIPPSLDEFLRIIVFLVLCIVYIAFWLNLGILFSVVFKQSATSALASIAIWLFFSVFFSIVINIFAGGIMNTDRIADTQDLIARYDTLLNIMRISPSYLFEESVSVLLSPTTRYLGLVTVEQTVGAVSSPLPLGQSLLLIWPQVTGMIAATLICFAIAYILFMRQEIRA